MTLSLSSAFSACATDDSIYPYTNVGMSTTQTVNNLQLWPGVRYFTSVRALSLSGYSRTLFSDGITVDTSPATVGVVLDGVGLWDIDAVSLNSSYSSRWFGFYDSQSGIRSYVWGLGTAPGRDDVVPFRNVGIATQHVARGLSLQHGSRYYASVSAVNGAGLRSSVASSDGVVTDTSRPLSSICAEKEEASLNPSFGEPTNTTECPLTSPDITTALEHWTTTDRNVRVLLSKEMENHGCVSVYLRNGSLWQNVITVIGVEYEVVLSVAVVGVCSHSTCTGQRLAESGALVVLPGVRQAILMAPPSVQNPSSSSTVWERRTLHFTAVSTTSRLDIRPLVPQTGLAIGMATVQRCVRSSPDPSSTHEDVFASNSNAIKLSQRYVSNDVVQLHASWDVSDAESSITEYQWSIGSVRGGGQYQAFRSAGRKRSDSSSLLRLAQSARLFVTVMAWNGANRERVLTSQEHVVDTTLADIVSLVDGTGITDIDYQSSGQLAVRWQVTDLESTVTKCSWSAGMFMSCLVLFVSAFTDNCIL